MGKTGGGKTKKEEEAMKEEERNRKKEEEKARKEAILAQHKLKKEMDRAEEEGLRMPEPVSAKPVPINLRDVQDPKRYMLTRMRTSVQPWGHVDPEGPFLTYPIPLVCPEWTEV